MPRLLPLLLAITLLQTPGLAQTTLISWNIRDFGQSKSEAEIAQIARIISDADLVALQEVVAGPGGAQAVARLAEALNHTGARWDYRISDPTASPPYKTERYAFLWKTSRVQLAGRPWLERTLPETVYREPFMGRFRIGGQSVLLANFHARRYDENPEEEIRLLVRLPGLYPGDIVVIAGDFNASESSEAFEPLYALGYRPALRDQKTTLRRSCDEGYLNHAIDNIYFPEKKIALLKAEAIDFVEDCGKLEAARGISDHLPVRVEW